MRLVFMGTPDFAVPALRALVSAAHDVPLVVTRPDRPKGRGLQLEPSPVKEAALELGLEVFQPEKPNGAESVERISAASPDLVIVVAFGAILRERLLSLGRFGALNVHASLLPKYRGMSPIQRAIWDGETLTGVTTMHMDQGVDTGDTILREEVPIGPDETGGELHDRLSQIGARLIVETLARLEAGNAPRIPQSGEASYAPRLDKTDGVIDWSLEARVVHNHSRALTPWPGSVASQGGSAVVVKQTRVAGAGAPAVFAPPGTILSITGDALRVACGSGAIDLLEVRPAGRATMTGAAFARGRRLRPGVDRFDPPAGGRLDSPSGADRIDPPSGDPR